MKKIKQKIEKLKNRLPIIPAKPPDVPLPTSLLTPESLKYLGAFIVPQFPHTSIRFSYGGAVACFRPCAAPPVLTLPGSLFMTAHAHYRHVAEISIPKPQITKDPKALPVATLLQDFVDITGPLRPSNGFSIGGMLVIGDRLHWTLHEYYNGAGAKHDSHGLGSLDLSLYNPEGLWYLGARDTIHSYMNAGYILEIPKSFADKHFGGMSVASGFNAYNTNGPSSFGPALFAYSLPPEDTPAGSEIPTLPLLYYPYGNQLPEHKNADSWTSGAWLTAGDKHAVIFIGRHGFGEEYYGEPKPGACGTSKGFHADPYEPMMLWYDPAEFLQVKDGKKQPWEVLPYLRWTGIKEHLFPDCSGRITGCSHDRENGYFYIVQPSAVNFGEPIPVVHVFGLE